MPARIYPKGSTCSVDVCDREPYANSLCEAHDQRRRDGGDLTTPIRYRSPKGKQKWRTDKKTGYRLRQVTVDGKQVNLREHRVVMAEVIGRELYRHETPHHKNGQRGDNRPENLELWSTSQPAGQRVEDKIAWAKEFLAQYGYEVRMIADAVRSGEI